MPGTCWKCGAAVDARFCPACKSLQPSSDDYFAFFELPRQLAVDSKDLEKRFYALSRKLHPDLFSRKPLREQEYALEASAVLNDAYRTLRDPVARAHYVLKQEGFDVAEQSTKDVPPELLEEVFELNMALEELRAGDEDARSQLEASGSRFETMRDEIDAELGAAFAAWDNGHDQRHLDVVRGLLNKRKYVTNLIAKAADTNVSN